MFLKFFNLVLFIVFILISVTFLTLLEQKLLSFIQIRKGPNKVGMIGLIQPFSDAMKLFSKELMMPINSNYLIYYFSPIFSLFISLVIWLSYPFFMKFFSFNLGLLFIFSCMSMGVYSMMVSGWSSNSNYSLLGSLRSIAQTISYEVCMIFFILCFFILLSSLNLNLLMNFQKYFSFFFLNYLISILILIIFFAETNRAPFDFAEGESELVSGFNVEYSGGGFAMIFLAEYSSILFLSVFFCFLFLNSSSLFYFFFFLKISMISFVFIWVRGSFPRFRYDKLMYLTWKIYLLLSLNFLILNLGLKSFFF